MSETCDAVIVGGGIVGAACAEALARDGLRVTVIEAAAVGGGATAAGMGHIVVMDDSEAQFALTSYSRDLWSALAARLPSQVEWDRCGTLWVAADEDEMLEVERKAQFCRQRAVPTEILDAQALAEAEPNLRAGLAGALLVPGDAVLYSPCAARWLLEQARARLRVGIAVDTIGEDGVKMRDGARISAGVTICAGGTWTASLLPEHAIRPRKGHLAITDRYPQFVRHQLVELGYLKSAHGSATESVAFNVQPRATGQVLIGSSRQFGNTDPAVNAPVLGRMLARALEYMPGLAKLSVIRTWTGFRAATADKLPFLGQAPAHQRVYVAGGHEGLGITTSLGTGQLLADLIAGRRPAIDPRPYLPCQARLQSA